jgi:hypothetical protein
MDYKRIEIVNKQLGRLMRKNSDTGKFQARYGFDLHTGFCRWGYTGPDGAKEILVQDIPEGVPGSFCETPIAEYMLKHGDYNDPDQLIITFKKLGANKLWSKLAKKAKVAKKIHYARRGDH